MNILGFIKESKWFQRTTYGEIYLDIEINEKEEITFRFVHPAKAAPSVPGQEQERRPPLPKGAVRAKWAWPPA